MWLWELLIILLLSGSFSYALGDWSEWSEWSSCTVPCGTGVQNRTRQCVEVSDVAISCNGEDTEFRECNSTICPDSDTDSSSGNIVIGVVVGGVLCLLIIIAIILTRHGRCLNGNKTLNPNKPEDKVIDDAANEDTMDSRLDYQNETQFEPSFIREIATDSGEKYVVVDPDQVYYKQKSTTVNDIVTIENNEDKKEDDQTSLHLEHRTGEIVPNPLYEEQADVNDSVVLSNVQSGLFQQHPRLNTTMDNPAFIEEVDEKVEDKNESESVLEKYFVPCEGDVEDIDNNSVNVVDETLESDLDSMQELSNILNTDNENDSNTLNSDLHDDDLTADTDLDSVEEENNPVFLDPFDALDLIQRASPYLFGDKNEIIIPEMPIVEEIFMDDIVEVEDEYFYEIETDSENYLKNDPSNMDDGTETESNNESLGSDDTLRLSDDESSDGANSVVYAEIDSVYDDKINDARRELGEYV